MRSNVQRVLQQGVCAAARLGLQGAASEAAVLALASTGPAMPLTALRSLSSTPSAIIPTSLLKNSLLVNLRGFASAAHPAAQPAAGEIAQRRQPQKPHEVVPISPMKPAPPRASPPPLSSHDAQSHTVRAEATYVGSRINVYDLLARPEFSSYYKRLHKGMAVLALTDKAVPQKSEAEGMPLGPYLVATTYGSAVFFGVEAAAKERWLAVLKEVAVDPVVGDKRYTEEYSLVVARDLPVWSQLEPECIRLQTLDLRNIQVVAQALAQSVALDFYSSHVERTLETFCSMNQGMAESATTKRVNKQELLQLVAENNIVMTEIISKLGVHERFDIAWKHVQYGRIWEFLRAELEMEPRFKTLDMKLNLIQDNLKYFLEILQARKSDSLEWTIIILIGAEICLSLYELGSKVT